MRAQNLKMTINNKVCITTYVLICTTFALDLDIHTSLFNGSSYDVHLDYLSTRLSLLINFDTPRATKSICDKQIKIRMKNLGLNVRSKYTQLQSFLKQSQKIPKNFDICFCTCLEDQGQKFISSGKSGHWVVSS